MKRKTFAIYAAAATLATVLGVSACGGTSAPSNAASPTPTATGTMKGVPFYKPSTVQSQTADSAVLTTPDHVTMVSNFYVNMVQTEGWTTLSKTITPHSGNLTIKKSGQGASISVAPSGSGSVISISTYPAG